MHTGLGESNQGFGSQCGAEGIGSGLGESNQGLGSQCRAEGVGALGWGGLVLGWGVRVRGWVNSGSVQMRREDRY